MQDEVEVVRRVLDKSVHFAGFHHDDIAGVQSDRRVVHDDGAAAPGGEVDLAQLPMAVRFVDALVGKADGRQRRKVKLVVPTLGGSGLIVPR